MSVGQLVRGLLLDHVSFTHCPASERLLPPSLRSQASGRGTGALRGPQSLETLTLALHPPPQFSALIPRDPTAQLASGLSLSNLAEECLGRQVSDLPEGLGLGRPEN